MSSNAPSQSSSATADDVVKFVKDHKVLILGGVIVLLSLNNRALRKQNHVLIKKLASADKLLKDGAHKVAQAEKIFANQSMWDYYYGK